MAHPRAIDLDLVNAQQARRILDRLVGYTLSPFLAMTIRRGLSAGRVQSVAVRMIVDREEEIKAFVPQEYWSIDAKLTAPPSKAVFAAAFYGDENGEIKIGSKEESDKLFEELEKEDFLVTAVKKGKKNRSPAPPFITSTLQQEASRKLGFQARRTMKAAQELYEGVEVEGMGSIGLITYMRTDSLRISEDAIRTPLPILRSAGAASICPASPGTSSPGRAPRTATRPSAPPTISLTPEQVKGSLTRTNTSFTSSSGSGSSPARWPTA